MTKECPYYVNELYALLLAGVDFKIKLAGVDTFK